MVTQEKKVWIWFPGDADFIPIANLRAEEADSFMEEEAAAEKSR